MLAPSSDPAALRLVAHNVPWYYTDAPRAFALASDKYMSLAIPVAVYWATSLFFYALDVLRPAWSEKFRIHEPAEIARRNRVSVARVVGMVLSQHAVQTLLGILVLVDTPHTPTRRLDADPVWDVLRIADWLHAATHARVDADRATRIALALYWWMIPWVQLWAGCFVMDAWQYMLHRLMHEVRFLYRTLHSHHHRLYVPYAFGALYNHPLEGLLLDTLSAALAQEAARMNLRISMVFFAVSTFKTVCDHCGYAFPWYYNPLHLFFPNSAAYHDVHHQSKGLRFNYSQPFFVHFDTLFNTRVDPDDFYAQTAGDGGAAAPVAAAGSEALRLRKAPSAAAPTAPSTPSTATRAVRPSTRRDSHYVLASRAGVLRAAAVLVAPLAYFLAAPRALLT